MIEAPKVHVHMAVSNLEKSREFYQKFFGVAPVKVKPGYVKFLAPFGPLNLALSETAPADGRGHVDHMGLQVETEDDTAGCAPTQPMKSSLGAVKVATSCCAPAR